ncbi:Histidine biosynthesis bifunctional protein HisB [Candidatus Johnevansia muelleri]|uniref:Imidazoleglycerol-phosphate dehydratase n=1 Tax=Candidatus Johnevansia muelleri TaxID=1495769 RepID=A0A078KE21_9GAMM|nr:Histidine biosynthesis bifunctional protein HisB [Candidatus Evansia muelleri]
MNKSVNYSRIACISRNTKETQIKLNVNLNGTGKFNLTCNVPFLEHLISQFVQYSKIDLTIESNGDIHIDDHHIVEDIGITLGKAFYKALGNKSGINRYGYAYAPLDEALSRVVIDFSGRAGLYMNTKFTRNIIGKFDTQLCFVFFKGFVNHAMVTLHIDNLKGLNAHHQAETLFKAFGLAIRMGIDFDQNMVECIPSTKGYI